MKIQVPDLTLRFGSSTRPSDRWNRILRTNRFTIGGLLIIGLGFPVAFLDLVEWRGSHDPIWDRRIWATLIICACALISAHVILRNVGAFALTADHALVLPSFLASFASVTAVSALARVDSSARITVLSLVCGGIWYMVVIAARRRASRPRIAIPGRMPTDPSLRSAQIEWLVLPYSSARLPDVAALVYDRTRSHGTITDAMLAEAVIQGVPVYPLDRFREMLTGRVSLDVHPAENFGALAPSRPLLRLKRLLDAVFSVPAILITLPLMILAGVLIMLESPGGVLYRQERMGYRGQPFICFKLRSMRKDFQGPCYTTEDDPRITRVGRFIRKWRIDELPQLFNVLRGDLSFIGPRPEAIALSEQYVRDIPFYGYRHSVRPGITGWAAVHQGNVAMSEAARKKLEYDFYYIKHCSIWLDFLIVLLTIRTIVTGFGSR